MTIQEHQPNGSVKVTDLQSLHQIPVNPNLNSRIFGNQLIYSQFLQIAIDNLNTATLLHRSPQQIQELYDQVCFLLKFYLTGEKFIFQDLSTESRDTHASSHCIAYNFAWFAFFANCFQIKSQCSKESSDINGKYRTIFAVCDEPFGTHEIGSCC